MKIQINFYSPNLAASHMLQVCWSDPNLAVTQRWQQVLLYYYFPPVLLLSTTLLLYFHYSNLLRSYYSTACTWIGVKFWPGCILRLRWSNLLFEVASNFSDFFFFFHFQGLKSLPNICILVLLAVVGVAVPWEGEYVPAAVFLNYFLTGIS